MKNEAKKMIMLTSEQLAKATAPAACEELEDEDIALAIKLDIKIGATDQCTSAWTKINVYGD